MFLALDQWLLWAACTLYFHLIFLDHVNQCRVQLGTNKVVLLQAFIIIRQRQTLQPWIILYFLHSCQYLKKLLNGAAVHLSFICLFV